jgi:hypothetical protein
MNKEKITKITKAVEYGLICQKNDDGNVEVIETTRLRINKAPDIEEYRDNEIEWTPSGLHSPNEWRLK